jgi:hypothetical protein
VDVEGSAPGERLVGSDGVEELPVVLALGREVVAVVDLVAVEVLVLEGLEGAFADSVLAGAFATLISPEMTEQTSLNLSSIEITTGRAISVLLQVRNPKIAALPDFVKRDKGARQYKQLAERGETPVLTIFLNEDYSPLKRYLQGRQKELTKIGSGQAHNRYAIDVGVALLVIHHEEEKVRINAPAAAARLSEALQQREDPGRAAASRLELRRADHEDRSARWHVVQAGEILDSVAAGRQPADIEREVG